MEPLEEGDGSMEDVWVEGSDQEDDLPEAEDFAPEVPFDRASSTSETLPEASSSSPVESARPTSIPLPDDSENWKRFEVLTSAPADHAFYTSVPTRPSKQFMTRLQKEYRILASSLPGEHPQLFLS